VAITRQPYFTVLTPFPGTPTVVCWQDTWLGHISVNERATEENRQFAITTLSNPTVVLAVAGNYVMFVNENERSRNSRAPFGVIVDPQGNPMPAVATIGHRRELAKGITKKTVLWLPRAPQT
jgi:hypothetical protein